MQDKKVNNDDIIIEEEFESQDIDKKIKKIKEELKACKKEKQDFLDGWQRSQADYINLKKRAEGESQENKEKFLISFVEDLLPVFDSFEMAIKNQENWQSVSKEWRVGMEYIFEQLKKILENNNISTINPLGEIFDHLRHHSIKQIDTDNEKEANLVVEVIQKGYALNDKIIRPAQVVVAIYDKK